MSGAAEESELVTALGRTFPSLAGLETAEVWRRVEALGVYAAQLWAAGQAALAQRGLSIPLDVFEALAPDAARVAQARRNGVAFLVRLRGALRDQRFGPLVAGVAQLLGRAQQTAPIGSQTNASMHVDTILETAVAEQKPSRTSGRIRYEIAGFEIVQHLGEGAMGKVFKARQKSLDRFVALKVLASQHEQDEDFVRRFEREGKVAAKIEHPNVVRVIEQGHDTLTGYRYIAFEFIDGQTLQEALKAREKFPEREALAIGKGVAEALAAAERAGVVHRDVKPGNIIVGKDGVPKLVDLGLAKKLDDKGITASLNYVMGTPAFISPEAASGAEVDHRADLYSLGLTIFRLVTGRLAHEAATPGQLFMKHTTEDCPDPRSYEPSVSDGAAKVILKLSARRPEDRYQSAPDAARDLDLVLQGKPPLLGAPVSFGAARAGPGAGMIPDDPPWTAELLPASVPDVNLAPPAPSDPADAMLRTLERSGDPEQLAEAIDRFRAAVSDARDPAAQARGEAALARAYLLRGDRTNAEERVAAALEKDPRCRPAVEVLWRAARGDADRSRLELALAQVKNAIAHGKLDVARKLAERIRDSAPTEPHPYLALAAIARLSGSEPDFVDSLRRAWSAYPSKDRADVTLGGLDGLVADVLVAHGRSAYRGDGSLLKATQEGLDEKANLIAGALRMAIAVGRVALEHGGLTLFEQRRLHFAAARALAGLRRYDAAADELARASQFKPSDVEQRAIEAEKAFLTYMRHMLDAQGAPRPKEAKYRCLGAQGLSAVAQQRAAHAGRERAARVFDIEKAGAAVVALSQKDPKVRAEIRQTAERLGQSDPFEQIAAAEKDLADITTERTGGESGEKPKATESAERRGLFSKLKGVASAAAAGVAGAAREAQLMLRETQARSRYETAVKRFATLYAKDLARDSRVPELQALARRAATADTQAVVYADEEARARKDVERLVGYA